MDGIEQATLWDPGDAFVAREEWLAAAVIAGLRVDSNRNRASHRARGRDKEVLNDIQGVIGEMVALRVLERQHGSGAVQHEVLHWGGGTGDDVQKAADLTVTVEGRSVRLESKCHLDGERKVMFLVNAKAHERSARRGALGYLPLVGALGHQLMRVGSLVRHDELDDWEIHTYQYGDPARRKRLVDVVPDLFAERWGRLRTRLIQSEQVASEETLRAVAHGAMLRFDQLRNAGFDLRGLAHDDLVERARAEARGCYYCYYYRARTAVAS